MLLISSKDRVDGEIQRIKFQSRNRDAFDFKTTLLLLLRTSHLECFNLVIEMLLISSSRGKDTPMSIW